MKKLLLLLGLLGLSCQVSAYDFDQVQIHGFASQGYLKSSHYDYLSAETEDGTFEFNEFGFNIGSNLTERLRLGMQILARDLGDSGNDDLTMDWAFMDYRYRNWLGGRFGKFKRAYGLYNQVRDIDAARNSVFLPLSVYNEDYRTVQQALKGISVYGTLPGGFDYQVQYGTLESGDETNSEMHDDSYILHVEWNTPLEGLKLVGTYDKFDSTATYTQDDVEMTFDTSLKDWLVGAEYSWGQLICATEYNEYTFDFGSSDTTGQQYYGLVNYRFTDWMALGASYAVAYGDKDDKDGRQYESRGQPNALAWSKDLALSARFDLNEYWLFKLEGHWINGLRGVSNYDEENPSEDGFLFAAKLTASF